MCFGDEDDRSIKKVCGVVKESEVVLANRGERNAGSRD